MIPFRSCYKIQFRYRSEHIETSNNPDAIVKMIDECPYKEGYELDWHYTLAVSCLISRKQIHCVTRLQKFYTKRVQYSRR